MSAVAWLLWGGAVAISVAYLVIRIAGLDERRLIAIQASSFPALPVIAAVPTTAQGALVASGALEVARPPPWLALFALVLASSVSIHRHQRRPRSCASGAGFVVATVNLQRSAAAARNVGQRLRSLGADLLVIQEYTAETAAACRSAGLHDRYAHRVEDPRDDHFGSALFSRNPVAGSDRVMIGRRPTVTATVVASGTAVTVANVHIQAPVHGHDIEPWRTAFDELGRLVERTNGPTILAGDWNAVLTHRPLRRLLDRHRLVDAHGARDHRRWRGPRTWPTDRGLLPPLLCLDHVVVTRDIGVCAVREERVPGTDHKAVIAHLRLPGT